MTIRTCLTCDLDVEWDFSTLAAPAEGLCMARPGEPCSDPVTHHHVTSVEELPFHLRNITPYRYFNLTIQADFDWLAAYFSGYHGVPGLRAAAAPAEELRRTEMLLGADPTEEWVADAWAAMPAAPAEGTDALPVDLSDYMAGYRQAQADLTGLDAAPAEGLDVEHPDCGDRCACYVRGVDDEAEATRD